MKNIEKRLQTYFITSVFSIIFALIGFSYNVWRLQKSEENNTVRIASFEVLSQLAEFEQILYAAHYDKNSIEGSPRKGWIKIGLITDMSLLISKPVEIKTVRLKELWSENWENISTDKEAINILVQELDTVRNEIRVQLTSLE